MSHIHFTTNESSRKNVIQLGEDPKKVFAVGSLGVDSIKQTKFLSREEFEEKAGFKLKPRNLMVTYHPATWGSGAPAEEFGVILGALDSLDGMGLIFTKSNADTGGRKINSMIEEYVAKNGAKAVCFDSMGQRMYLSALQFVDAVVGNSSSGIAEAPSFGIGTVNIGERQEGRLKGDSVIDCAPTKEALADAFRKIYNRQFNEKIKAAYNPYGDGKTAPRITAVLKGLAPEPLKKKFHALDFKVMP
jgi:GDP/UDP-N,N'-diacetylbacillosamine 2-epimerase (hydrolysing)